MNDLEYSSSYDEIEDKLVQKVSYDNRAVLEANLLARNAEPETDRYKGNLVHIGSIHLGDIERLKNEGFNLLSSDPDEVKRALLHIQSNEKHLLTTNGDPIAKTRKVWI